jgi:diguanylate cyclase
LDWGRLPDVGAVALLTCAFASVARRGFTAVSGLWLTGWLLIDLHFVAFVFAPDGRVGPFATFIGLASLTWAGIIFMWACVPYRDEVTSRWMLGLLLGGNTLYLAVLNFAPPGYWALAPAAFLLGFSPLGVALVTIGCKNHPLRWSVASLYGGLGAFLLAVENQPNNGNDLALNAVFFTVYFGCGIHFWYTYRRATTGALITIAGFLAWAMVFVAAPGISTFFPSLRLEDEVWNLPKYVVAVGMILLLLESQIEHNKYLALHDELTGLPNRRLFQDRLAGALERAHRSGKQAALLLVDLDYFKQVNDTAGHHVGDLLLKHAGEIFLGRVRRSDTVARTGGDEFSVILEEPTSREDAEMVGQSLMQLLNQPIDLEGHLVRIGASVGIAVYPEDAMSAEALCIAADRKMYREKYAGRAVVPIEVSQPSLAQPFPPEEEPMNLEPARLRTTSVETR